jgi:hypothetical protein
MPSANIVRVAAESGLLCVATRLPPLTVDRTASKTPKTYQVVLSLDPATSVAPLIASTSTVPCASHHTSIPSVHTSSQHSHLYLLSPSPCTLQSWPSVSWLVPLPTGT